MCSRIVTHGKTTFMCIGTDCEGQLAHNYINDTEPIADSVTIHKPRKPISGGVYFILAELAGYLALTFLIVAILVTPPVIAR